jgi:hypothetical protein
MVGKLVSGPLTNLILTYMSIRDEIKHWIGEGRLFLLTPALASSPCSRTMFVADELNRLILGPWASQEDEFRFGKLRADLDMFIDGSLLSVAQAPYKKPKTTYLARLDPMVEEVWEIRSRDPKPGIRVFGRFAEKDVFVALTWEFRDGLGGPASREWRDAREGCKAEWRKLFPTYPALGRDNLHDYASNIFLV